jgi:small-conductance mechanosensitive channel
VCIHVVSGNSSLSARAKLAGVSNENRKTMMAIKYQSLLRPPWAALLTIVLAAAFAPASAQTQNGPAPAGSEGIIPFLDQTIVWYRQLSAQQQLVSEPSDVLFLSDNRQTADQIVSLSFEFARARAQALGSEVSTGGATSGASQYQRLAELTAQADQKVQQTQQELDGMRARLNRTAGSKRRTLQVTIAETESELELFKARRDVLHNFLQVSASGGGGKKNAVSLPAQIEELARTVPAAAAPKEAGSSSPSSPNVPSPPALTTPEHRSTGTGLFAVVSNLFGLRRKMDSLDDSIRQTDALAESAKSLRAPLVAKIRELTQKGDQLAAQADSADPAGLAQEKKDLDALTAEYKQLSASLLPLGRQALLLDLYKRSTASWRNAVYGQYASELKGLLVRLAGLGIILGLVLGISEIWRRATFRYVTDARRRNQFLLLRRIVLWGLIAIILAVAFASELGAITTFAGLLTAGIAVALQNVILSVAGYFFLIGKYGVRVGDRVQVAGITGDVVDIGMVRLHLMEVTGGTSPRPTGRVVAFSNAVVFQANAGLFKQFPGTNFLWHEITLTLQPESDYHHIEERMLNAVNKVYAEYRERMEMQRRTMERSLHAINVSTLAPESRVRLTGTGLEVVIRYPVELNSATTIDDRITRELLEAIGREPQVRLLGAHIEAQSA